MCYISAWNLQAAIVAGAAFTPTKGTWGYQAELCEIRK